MSAGPIFIIGNPRSGTTLLRLMLTCHPRIVIPPEAGFAMLLRGRHGGFRGGREGVDGFVQDLLASPKFEHWRLDAATLNAFLEKKAPASYADLVAGAYKCYASVHQPGKTRWGDKNNFYLDYIAAIASLFPAAVFLHIVRDGRDVACSYRSLSGVRGKYAPTLPDDTFDAVCAWNDNLRRIRGAFARIGWKRVFELRYEDLVHDTVTTLQKTCAFLGEAYAPEMLDYDRANRERELEPREFDAWKSRNREGIDASAIGRWEKEMSEREITLAELAGGSLLRRYGYTLHARPASVGERVTCASRRFAYRARRLKKGLRSR